MKSLSEFIVEAQVENLSKLISDIYFEGRDKRYLQNCRNAIHKCDYETIKGKRISPNNISRIKNGKYCYIHFSGSNYIRIEILTKNNYIAITKLNIYEQEISDSILRTASTKDAFLINTEELKEIIERAHLSKSINL